MPVWLDGRIWAPERSPTSADGAAVVAVVLSWGSVVVGALIGVTGGGGAGVGRGRRRGEGQQTHDGRPRPTRAPGPRSRVPSRLRIRCPIYLRRKRQA